ncbi:DNA-binding transcriptional LysR family regulator [Paraburkholderia sp. BL6669N2]|uniref:LysR substrate-binding domain-containing protein n=1 Tax=Paraburkholderia sp. BL6669N2 TaxID=1938807 RepID=UPI000E279E24|nr:LysR family transcriptional regulator [Paraburkholderia sp. BL6669N2]REG45507.1 DNA-binding transcriptional LysR family regulator [Paraburkholderia sp. BL6669N2]
MDKLSAMKAFVRVIEAGTFTKAADSIGIPKGQLSRLIQSLEQTLRTPLLNRSTRRVIATPDGASYYECVVRLLNEMEDLETRISRATASPRGKLRVGTPSEIANGILLPAIDEFCGRYPDIEIDITVGDRPMDILGENIDCALHVGRVMDPSLVARKVGDIRRILCASPTYLERFGVPQSPSDIENGQHRVISYFLKGCVRHQYALQSSDDRCELVATSTIAVDDGYAMVSAALAGLGMAVISMFMAAPHMANHTLLRVLPDWHASALPLHIVYPPNRRMNAKLRVFIDWTGTWTS